MPSRKFDKGHPGAGAQIISSGHNQNYLAISDKILGASAVAQATPDMTVVIGDFVYLGSDNVTRKSYAGGNSPAFTAPTTNPKIGLLTCDDAGTLAWTYGAEAASPLAPNPPAGKVPICEVYGRVAMTSIKDSDDGTHGFVQRQASAIVPVPKIPSVYVGQCRLTKSGANLLLSPYQGNLLTINSVVQTVPDAGVTLGTGGLAASTTYFIYAFMSGATMTLEASTTAHATQAGTGVEIKSGDATRTLVGLARTIATIAWADSATQRFVLSYFNRVAREGRNRFTTTRSTVSTSYVELNTEIRIEFVLWADEVVSVSASGKNYNDVATINSFCGIGFDGTTPESVAVFNSDDAAAGSGSGAGIGFTVHKSGLAEGYHYATVLGKTGATGTANWYADGTTGHDFSMTARVG